MDAGKPIIVVNIPMLRFVGGTKNQEGTDNSH